MFEAGDLIRDRYRVVRRVGRGGTGEVYEAEDTATGATVALKTVQPELVGSTKVVQRFERECRFSQRISHPNVLRISHVFQVPIPEGRFEISTGEALEVPCMVMEYLEGETLADRLGRGERIPQEEAKPLVCQMAAALAAAHRAGVVHRDLKPDNMFLVPAADGTRVVLTDFGVARHAAPSQEESLTASNVLLGTPTYMAPEQLELEEAMPASDLYTLGLVMFEMVAGRPPFEAETAIKTVFKRVQEDAPSPREVVPDLDRRWEEVILRCLERQPEDRYSDAQEIIRALDGDDSPYLVAERHDLRKILLWVAVAAVVIAAVVAAALML
jgi:serine/threonine protein kinase